MRALRSALLQKQPDRVDRRLVTLLTAARQVAEPVTTTDSDEIRRANEIGARMPPLKSR